MRAARPGGTISLFGFGQGGDNADKPKTRPPPKARPAPRGVPTISKWRQNRDGSISGFISGSPAFDDGEAVTTSPIVEGEMALGNVVQTGSGSRSVYSLILFLEPEHFFFAFLKNISHCPFHHETSKGTTWMNQAQLQVEYFLFLVN